MQSSRKDGVVKVIDEFRPERHDVFETIVIAC